MPIVACPTCSSRLRFSAEMVGKKLKCPRCGAGAVIKLAQEWPQDDRHCILTAELGPSSIFSSHQPETAVNDDEEERPRPRRRRQLRRPLRLHAWLALILPILAWLPWLFFG